MADERKFALPDSMQFRAFYAQKRRRSRNSIVAPITRTFIDLDPIANAYYEIAAPITFSGDFEIEVEFSTSTTGTTMILGNLSSSVSYLATVGTGNQLRLNVNGAIIETPILAINDGKLHKVKVTRASGVVEIYIDNFLRASGTTTDSLSFDVVGRFQDGLYFNGIIANAKFTDKSGASDVVTTFRLDNSPAAANYTYSTELLDNNTFPDNANARQYLVATKGWIITDGGAV